MPGVGGEEAGADARVGFLGETEHAPVEGDQDGTGDRIGGLQAGQEGSQELIGRGGDVGRLAGVGLDLDPEFRRRVVPTVEGGEQFLERGDSLAVDR